MSATGNSKQEARLEKKKKKAAALVELIKLNETDRRQKSASESDNNNSLEENHQQKNKRKKVESSVSVMATGQSELELKSKIITNDEYTEMKKTLINRQRTNRSHPKIRIKTFGEMASMSMDPTQRTPIFLTDIQDLLMKAILGESSPSSPARWCHIERASKITHTIVLLVEGCSSYMYTNNESQFLKTNNLFEHKLEIVMPKNIGQDAIEQLMIVPQTDYKQDELIEKYGSLEAALESTRNQSLLVKSVFPVDGEIKESKELTKVETPKRVSRTQLLLSAIQMVENDYPMPLQGELANRYRNYVFTSDSYAPVTDSSPLFGLDCEMCLTQSNRNELTRISVVNEKYENVYETLVRPENKIIDYLTVYSGITAEMMINVTKTLKEVQEDIRNLLPPDAILVGQSLNFDLIAMQMMHPYVIDTSVIFNISGTRQTKSKLQTLSYEFLGEQIQLNRLGHDSIEDCTASLKLAMLKMRNGIDFGDAVLCSRKRVNNLRKRKISDDKLTENDEQQQQPTGEIKKKRQKTTTIITSTQTNINYEKFIDSVDHLAQEKNKNIHCIRVESNKSAIRKTCDIAIQNDLTVTHIKLENIDDDNDVSIENNQEIHKLDKWISNCWQSLAPSGLFVVILASGSEQTDDNKTNNGVCMLKIK